MLGILDSEGFPMENMGVMAVEEDDTVIAFPTTAGAQEVSAGKRCHECGNYAVVRRDGCDFCTACGALGGCG